MRIRKPSTTSVSATSPPYSSSPSSFHSSSSVITAASSADSSTSSSPHNSSTRCKGLDLLVKAIHHVSAGGSIVGVPYIQRRSVTRRRRRLNYIKFSQFFVNNQMIREEREKEDGSETKSKKQRRRVMALPSKYHDSVLQQWRLRSRSVTKVND